MRFAFQSIGLLAAAIIESDAESDPATTAVRQFVFNVLGLLVVGAPAVLFAVLGIASLLRDRPLSERVIARCVQSGIVTGLLAAISILVLMLVWNDTQVPIEIGSWVNVENHDLHKHYHFVFKFEFDQLSVPPGHSDVHPVWHDWGLC